MPSFLAVEIGGTKLQLAVGTADGKVLHRHRSQIAGAAGAEGIRSQIEEAIPTLLAESKPAAAAIGFGGPVDRPTGRVALSHQIHGWSEFPLRSWFQELTGLPTLIENDANIAALGEAHLGAGVGADPIFYVTLGSGVGGGLVVDGRIYHGASPGEAELGHLRLDRQNTTLESRCSGWAVDARIRHVCAAEPTSRLAELVRSSPGSEARHLKMALTAKDPTAERVLAETAADLAFGLSHMVHLMHPERIILGGGLALTGDPLRQAVAQALPPHLMEIFRPGPEIHLAALGEDTVPIGCLIAASLEFSL